MSKTSKFLALVTVSAVGVGAYHWYDDRRPESDSIGLVTTSTIAPDVSAGSTEPPSTGSGTVSPPVSVHDDTVGDDTFDQVLEDWTPVEGPIVPERSAEVRAEWVENSRIQRDLPDGTYWGFLHSVFDEEDRGLNFDVVQVDGGLVRASDGDQLYPAYLDDLLYASVVIGDAEPGEVRNTYVSPTTLWSIANGESAPDDIEVRTWYVLTVIDGKVVAAEGATPVINSR